MNLLLWQRERTYSTLDTFLADPHKVTRLIVLYH